MENERLDSIENQIANFYGNLQEILFRQAVVIGFIDFKGLSKSPGYKAYYRTATRFLGKDPNRDVSFAVVTDPRTASEEFGIYSFPAATLSMWNETLVSWKFSWPGKHIFPGEIKIGH